MVQDYSGLRVVQGYSGTVVLQGYWGAGLAEMYRVTAALQICNGYRRITEIKEYRCSTDVVQGY
jgi:hypothetical protein